MESDYNQKFEEMKSYIPFLQYMITKLSVGKSLTNARQRQLDKIKSLRDLLLNKKKRMKMENLLKCEQVLITLHEKVAVQNEPSEGTDIDSDYSGVNFVRNKLKLLSAKNEDTLPGRPSDAPQEKNRENNEPTLFLRRSNRPSLSPEKSPLCDKKIFPSKRNYTRVLESPENLIQHCSGTEKLLFSRRSPKKITEKHSLKKGKKKLKKSKNVQLNDFNITLNVPEEKLHSLGTEDILSRIINCSDNDVDIATLRELRSQILEELKNTGVKDDITDLLLKSCPTNKKKRRKSEEVEEGELSDSESEAIENIYGNLIITNKETSEKDNTRKIKICLVLNSDKNEQQSKTEPIKSKNVISDDSSELETFPQTTSLKVVTSIIKTNENQLPEDEIPSETNKMNINNKDKLGDEMRKGKEQSDDGKSIEKVVKLEEKNYTNNESVKEKQTESNIISDVLPLKDNNERVLPQDNKLNLKKSKCFVPNFYTSTNVILEESDTVESKKSLPDNTNILSTSTIKLNKELPIRKDSVEIPLLNLEDTAKQDIVSEIDILQALKKEILETTTPDTQIRTPALHQPKITKVASSKEIVKKRISIEKYKQKCQDPPQPLFFSEKKLTDDLCKKQSLKLTEKEYERFNLPTKLPLSDSSDDDIDYMNISLVDHSNDMAPKSPDHEDFADTGIKPPVIIPCDPVSPSVVNSFVDVDLRNINNDSLLSNDRSIVSETKMNMNIQSEKQIRLSDPRKLTSRCDKPQSDIDILVPPLNVADVIENQLPNMTPSRVLISPNMTTVGDNMSLSPSLSSNVTSSYISNKAPTIRTYQMTPSRLDSEDILSLKHVYAPMLSGMNRHEGNEIRHTDMSDTGAWEAASLSRDVEYDSRDPYGRPESPQTPISSYGRLDNTPLSLFGRMECPSTPLPSFGRNERGMTPANSYRRVDGSTTPIHQSGRNDDSFISTFPYNRSETHGHSFARLDDSSPPTCAFSPRDIPAKSSSSFRRHERSREIEHHFSELDGSGTPAYSYNIFEGASTPYHSFERNESYSRNEYLRNYHPMKPTYGRTDPRLTRTTDYDDYIRQRDRDYSHYIERTFHSDYSSDLRDSEYARWYDRNFNRTEMKTYRDRHDERYTKDNTSGRDQCNKYSVTKDREVYTRRNKSDYKYYNEKVYKQPEKSQERNHSANRTVHSSEKVNSSGNHTFVINKSIATTFQKLGENDKGLDSFHSQRQRAASVGRTSTFDKRRQRAASVGRHVTREPSIVISADLNLDRPDFNNKRKGISRAASVGRELQSQCSESFKSIKDDLRSFKLKNDLNIQNKFKENISDKKNTSQNKCDKADIKKVDGGNQKKKYNETFCKSYRDSRLRPKDDKSQNQRTSGIIYSDSNISKGTILGTVSSVKNYKIPKIKRMQEKVTENPTNDREINIKKAEEKIETLDITKIKKKTTENENDKSCTIKDENCKVTILNKKCDKEVNEDKHIDGISDGCTENSNEELKVRRSKRFTTKLIIYDDSDSGSDKNIETEQHERVTTRDNIDTKKIGNTGKKVINLQKELNPTLKKTAKLDDTVLDLKNIQDNSCVTIDGSKIKGIQNELIEDNVNKASLISSQGEPGEIQSNSSNLDHEQTQSSQQNLKITKDNLKEGNMSTDKGTAELNPSFEIFTDNIVSDPILDNINELIADLDHDLDTVKSTEVRAPFRQDFLWDHMFDSIKEDNIITEQEKKNGVSIKVLTDKENITSLTEDVSQEQVDRVSTNSVNSSESMMEEANNALNCGTATVKAKNIVVDNNSNDAIVSTTKDDTKLLYEDNITIEKSLVTFKSKPDSTMNAEKQSRTVEVIVPDSTNEANEFNELISSSNTHNTLNVASSQNISKNVSIDNFISILQDKSKIKELLSLLGEHAPENEKIKRKLEKLSEIVSDDEDENNDKETVSNNEKNNTGNMDENKKNDMDKLDKTLLLENVETDNLEDNRPEETNKLNITIEKLDNNTGLNKQDCNLELEVNDTPKNDTKNPKKKNITVYSDVEPEYELELKNKTTKGKSKEFTKTSHFKENRSASSDVVGKTKVKKLSRELMLLQADIREVFVKEDEEILGGKTGLRMCRLAKLMDGINQKKKRVETQKKDPKLKKNEDTKKKKAKKRIKIDKVNTLDDGSNSTGSQNDPYLFETDSICESITTSEKKSSTEDDSDSAESAISEFSDKSGGIKRSKRKRGAWKSGIILPKNRKKKPINEKLQSVLSDDSNSESSELKMPDINCYIDKSYFFSKDTLVYDCRLCDQKASDIVYHYRKEHPHSEIPLSRMSPDIALGAIKQCETMDFLAIRQIPSHRYVCRFCFKEFVKCKTLENFFWHVVSTHTGEYKQACTVCIEGEKCPLALDIPPCPQKQKGQLIGYICGNCNYTQLSLENLKTHVITRHDDEQTAVYTINMSQMTTKAFNMLLRRTKNIKSTNDLDKQRVLRSCRSNESTESNCTSSSSMIQEPTLPTTKTNSKTQSKITFESDSDSEKTSQLCTTVDISRVKDESTDKDESKKYEAEAVESEINTEYSSEDTLAPTIEKPVNECVNEIDASPHFKVTYSQSGSKQYVCCINNNEHYKSALLISFKKHIQTTHTENWDGYCCVCKLIVMQQGRHSYKNCLDHFIDKHLDNFPVLENTTENVAEKSSDSQEKSVVNVASDLVLNETPVSNSPTLYLTVRPLSELLSNESHESSGPSPRLVIENVVSLTSNPPHSTQAVQDQPIRYLYEEAQATVMSLKNKIILETMMTHDKLVQVFKCAGRFCSFSTDSAEEALLHVTTHVRIGGDNALKCAYCDFDCLKNAIDLVTHVFKCHGFCQYVCGHCFYRAAASQLVNAHIARAHQNTPVKVVLKTSFTTESIERNALSREVAVPIYACSCENEPGTQCKFKTFTPGKLCEHIKTKHQNVILHVCFICKATTDSIGELIQHYKVHGMKLYQCAWCVFGADNETEILSHTSVHHATCQPKAYLRVITNKEGTSEFRVLPLANLNKSNVPDITEVDVGSLPRENPVKEAERSIDLEKLIGHTSLNVPKAVTDTLNETPPDEFTVAASMLNIVSEPVSRPHTPFAPVAIEEKSTPIIKTEAVISTTSDQSFSDVINLDSDEDDTSLLNVSKQSAPMTPTPEPASPAIKRRTRVRGLYRCGNCSEITKNASVFKAHLGPCFMSSNKTRFNCAFCPFVAGKKKLVEHYKQAHFQNNPGSSISEPTSSEGSEKVLFSSPLNENNKNHDFSKCCQQKADVTEKELTPKGRNLKSSGSSEEGSEKLMPVENNTNIVFSMKKVDGVTVRQLSAKNRKRKSTTVSGEEPTPKINRYGPQDVSQLPINPIFDSFVYCSLCEFNTKVRLNMVRHLSLHTTQQPVPQTAPVNPVPHLETNEMHFDRMVNLASSSIVTRTDKSSKSDIPTVPLPSDRVSHYPKYVPERTRHTCGAKDCSYISLDENMLKYHWETLHSGNTDFHCVHCPSYQTMDKKTPLSATRIITHLKMHDAMLYACSECKFYHFKHAVLEKHVNEVHKVGSVMVVREETSTPQVATATTASAPTMDLKPWQCGVCEYKSLLRPQVVDHCAKFHNSKMQFKCVYCAFRTSNEEYITKHQLKSHAELPAVTFYFYYREGSMPGASDGTPFWKMQSNKYIPDAKIKSEKGVDAAAISPTSVMKSPDVNLSLVKQEVVEESIENLCQMYGQFCEPNGLSYKCPLCKTVVEDTKEAMQSHLFEELKYRRWRCSICLYKGFHKHGLKVHMETEHHINRDPVELPVDSQIETWVSGLLDHQETLIHEIRNKLAQQKSEMLRENLDVPEIKTTSMQETSSVTDTANKPSNEELESSFGALGKPKDLSFCCPKCNELIKEENAMRIHLENELNKIRWCCSSCPLTFISYHQAQFHCKTHSGQSSRPVTATRNFALRSAWVDAAIEVQKLNMPPQPSGMELQQAELTEPEPVDNSLLVVRYEEKVPTPEAQSSLRRVSSDSDDDRLVISNVQTAALECSYCVFSCFKQKKLKEHVLKHYNLKPYTCIYCKTMWTLRGLRKHQTISHRTKPLHVELTPIPNVAPKDWIVTMKNNSRSSSELICLICRYRFSQSKSAEHLHDDVTPEFGSLGEVVFRCSTCDTLHKDYYQFEEHKKRSHSNEANYEFYRLYNENWKGEAYCSYCPQKFILKFDLKAHIEAAHAEELKYATIEPRSSKDVIVLDDEDERMAEVTPSRKVARKSTSKSAFRRSVARKSTTKFPMESQQEYSFYGKKPCVDSVENVTMMMPFLNSFVPITYKRLNKVFNVNPQVVLTKVPKED